MPRVMAVVVLVGGLVWALVFVDFGRPRARRTAAAAEPAAAPAPTPALESAPPRQAVAPKPAPDPAAAHAIEVKPGAAPPAGITARPRSGMADPLARTESTASTANLTRTTGALSTATGELGEGNLSPEYAEMERTYAHEPRDGVWAEAEEERLRTMLAGTPLGSAVGLVNCQETLCRMLFESDDYELFDHLLAAPGFAQATGLSRASPYSHRSGQLSVYFQRRGAR